MYVFVSLFVYFCMLFQTERRVLGHGRVQAWDLSGCCRAGRGIEKGEYDIPEGGIETGEYDIPEGGD